MCFNFFQFISLFWEKVCLYSRYNKWEQRQTFTLYRVDTTVSLISKLNTLIFDDPLHYKQTTTPHIHRISHRVRTVLSGLFMSSPKKESKGDCIHLFRKICFGWTGKPKQMKILAHVGGCGQKNDSNYITYITQPCRNNQYTELNSERISLSWCNVNIHQLHPTL